MFELFYIEHFSPFPLKFVNKFDTHLVQEGFFYILGITSVSLSGKRERAKRTVEHEEMACMRMKKSEGERKRMIVKENDRLLRSPAPLERSQ